MIGQNIGPYKILEQIGAGGMAKVYKAYHEPMERYVAIKVLPAHMAQDPNFSARFAQEVRTVTRLEHPFILPVYDSGNRKGMAYIVMRYLETDTLGDLMAKGRPHLRFSARLIQRVSEALDYAHTQGVVHRDIKPSNILVDKSGQPYIADFGIAKILESSLNLTGAAIVGTPAYMSPEQGQGHPIDQRSDIYSLGVVLYELVTGKRPFVADTAMAILQKHIHAPLPLPSSIVADIPPILEDVIVKSLAKNRDVRYLSAGALADDLERAIASTGRLAGEPIRPDGTPRTPIPIPLQPAQNAPRTPILPPVPVQPIQQSEPPLAVQGELPLTGSETLYHPAQPSPAVPAEKKTPGEPPPPGRGSLPPRSSHDLALEGPPASGKPRAHAVAIGLAVLASLCLIGTLTAGVVAAVGYVNNQATAVAALNGTASARTTIDIGLSATHTLTSTATGTATASATPTETITSTEVGTPTVRLTDTRVFIPTATSTPFALLTVIIRNTWDTDVAVRLSPLAGGNSLIGNARDNSTPAVFTGVPTGPYNFDITFRQRQTKSYGVVTIGCPPGNNTLQFEVTTDGNLKSANGLCSFQ